jgi:indolepyruvate decarboxylase
LIEPLLCKDPETYYNDVAQRVYQKLSETLGCADWLTARATTTCGELDKAIKTAESSGESAYIQVVADKYGLRPRRWPKDVTSPGTHYN